MNYTLGIAGDRNYTDYKFFSKVVQDEIQRLGIVTEIIIGDYSGVDAMALDWAMTNGIMHTVYCASRYNYIRMQRDGINAILCSDWKIDGTAVDSKRIDLFVQDSDSILLFKGFGPGNHQEEILRRAKQYERPVEVWQLQSQGIPRVLHSLEGTVI